MGGSPIGEIVAGAIGGLGSVGVGIANLIQQDKHNQQQMALSEGLTRESWARDDNAVQRRVADLKAAGLSPTLAAGSSAGVSAPIKPDTQAPQYQGISPSEIAMQVMRMRRDFARQDKEIEVLDQEKEYKHAQTLSQYEATKSQVLANEAASYANELLREHEDRDAARHFAEMKALNNSNSLHDLNRSELEARIESTSAATDLRSIDFAERLHNLEYYSKFGLPTNVTGHAAQAAHGAHALGIAKDMVGQLGERLKRPKADSFLNELYDENHPRSTGRAPRGTARFKN